MRIKDVLSLLVPIGGLLASQAPDADVAGEVSMEPLGEAHTLTDLQRYVAAMEQERGFAGRNVMSQCLLLGEEVGELFKAVRKSVSLPTDPHSRVGAVEEELADVLIFVCSIANRLNIDLEAALREKESLNEQRVWV